MGTKSFQINSKRHLKVYHKVFIRAYKKMVFYPEIRLCGKWLREIGFESGKSITIEHTKHKIIITINQDKN